MANQLFDISMPIHESMPVYKNKPEKKPEVTITSNFPEQTVRESRVHLDVHTGTHIDAPLHMLPNGATIETLSLDRLVRPCTVFDVTHADKVITAADIEHLQMKAGDFVLFKTTNSFDDSFNPDFVYVAEDAARILTSRKIDGVGIDGLGIERSQSGHPTHKLLFDANVIIIEGLRLAHIAPGEYELMALPLKLQGLDAAPARVLLRRLQ